MWAQFPWMAMVLKIASRTPFERRWVQFNIVRTVTAVASFVTLAWALRLSGA